MNCRKQEKFHKKAISMMLLFSMVMINVFASHAVVFAQDKNVTKVASQSNLKRFTTDLTLLAKEDRLNSDDKYKSEVNRLIQVLASKDLRQPALLDETGEAQEFVVEGLAKRIAKGDVPATLKDKKVLMLQMDAVFDNAKSDADVSHNISTVLNELASTNGNVILFVDELANFVGSSEINEKIIAAVAKGNAKIIGGTSKDAFEERIVAVAEVAAIFTPLMIGDKNYKGSRSNDAKNRNSKLRYRGDNVSADIRSMLKEDPTGKKRVDVILQAKDINNASFRDIMAKHNVQIKNRIGKTDTLVVNMPLSAVEALSKRNLTNFMSPDRKIAKLGHLEKTTGAKAVRNLGGGNGNNKLEGTGVAIAVVDSGMHVNHKTFKRGNSSRVVYSQDFTGEGNADDNYGHGTHVAGIAAGGSKRNASAYLGIAPDADIVNLKVLDSNGVGNTSWLLNALEWIKQNHAQYNIRVVNLSLGGAAVDSYTNDPVNLKVQELNAEGILVVAAAGNDGKAASGEKIYGHIHSPGNDPSVLTVGAVNTHDTDASSDDGITSFSSRGPTRSHYTDANGNLVYDNAIKPDMVAPGNKIGAAKSKVGSYLPTNYPSLVEPGMDIAGDDDDVMIMSGTSMAAPAVAGAAALLFQLNPNLTPSMVKMIMQYTAQPLAGYNMLEQGAGQLNLDGAVRLAKAYRTDIDFNSMASGGYMIASGQSMPAASTTINGNTFNWSGGITTNHGYIKSIYLVYYFNNVYRNGMWFQKGVSNNSTTYNYYLNNDFHYGMYMNFMPKVTDSNGTSLGDGAVKYAYGVIIGDGVLLGDGVIVSDGVLLADGTLVSDGVLLGDGVLLADGVLLGDRMGANGVLLGDRMGANGVLLGDRMGASTSANAIFGD